MRRTDILFNLRRCDLAELTQERFVERLNLVGGGATVTAGAVDRAADAGVETDNALDALVGTLNLLADKTPAELAVMLSTTGVEVSEQNVLDAIGVGLPDTDGSANLLQACAWLFANFQAPE